ncbi:MAG TPA: hypothetical protein VKP65_24830 [Rhodothermales bacterium]|nr:hypothetical protein [Rhodothermales bacterium]
MRFLSFLISVVLLVSLSTGCGDPAPTAVSASPDGDVLAASKKANTWGRSNGAVTLPLKAVFFSDETGFTPDPTCGVAPPYFRVTQEGFGEATHLGRFTFYATFCVDATDVLDGMLTAGESIPYFDGFGTLTAANGDELWIELAGEILPVDDPVFEYQFSDPFDVVGGTGRFDGASGSGVTNSFVDTDISRTQHEWSGVLTLPRGK